MSLRGKCAAQPGPDAEEPRRTLSAAYTFASDIRPPRRTARTSPPNQEPRIPAPESRIPSPWLASRQTRRDALMSLRGKCAAQPGPDAEEPRRTLSAAYTFASDIRPPRRTTRTSPPEPPSPRTRIPSPESRIPDPESRLKQHLHRQLHDAWIAGRRDGSEVGRAEHRGGGAERRCIQEIEGLDAELHVSAGAQRHSAAERHVYVAIRRAAHWIPR